MTVTIDLDKNPFFREAVERVRRRSRIDSIEIVLHARFPESRPEDLSRLQALSQDELNEMLSHVYALRPALSAGASLGHCCQISMLRESESEYSGSLSR
ncbi:hypothetical protein SAMN05443247_01316 [Bradyrhizobium erythrophlei]|nr:hypothetical protein SAMN05443247_01316 [Bradyrhizobium erythrophlei]